MTQAAPRAWSAPPRPASQSPVTDPRPPAPTDASDSAPGGDLWAWSVRALAIPPLRRAILTLQDTYGMSGSLVLWCAWAPMAGLLPPHERALGIAKRTEALDRFAIRRLREVRRHLASPRSGYDPDAVAALRLRIYEAELDAEHLVLDRLDDETRRCPDLAAPHTDPEEARAAARGLFTLCRDNLELPVLLADDLGASGPGALFEQILAHAPPAREAATKDEQA